MEIVKFILPYLKKSKLKLVFYFIMSIFQWASVLLIPIIISKYIDKVFYNKFSDWKLIILFIVLILIWTVSSYLSSFSLQILCNNLSYIIQTDAFKHLRKAKLNDINSNNPTVLTSKINNGAFLIPAFFLNTLLEAVLSLLGLLVILIIMAYMNSLILLAMLVILILNFCVVKLFKKPLEKVNYKLQEKQNLFFAALNDQITSIKVIKTNVWFDEVEKGFDNIFDKLRVAIRRHAKINVSYSVLVDSFKYIAILILILIITNGMLTDKISVGDFQLLYSYSNIALGYLAVVMGLIPNYQQIKAYYARFKEVRDIPIEHNGEISINEILSIKVNNLTFSYNDNTPVLEDITTIFEKGKLYLLRGGNGRGKSTFLNVILGLYEDYKGEVFYNNELLKDMDLYDTRKRLVCKVEQEPKLINADVFDNLIYGNNRYDDEYLNLLVEKFKIPSLDTIINSKSDNISGGEKQKISIIRSLLKIHNNSNSLLILDEPSSALDVKAIEVLIELLSEIKKNHTVIVISHDNSFDQICDEVLSL